MGMMKGLMPIRYTQWYLNQGDVYLRDSIRVLLLYYSVNRLQFNHRGAKEFVFWHWAQLQHRNPDVQLDRVKDSAPAPFFRVFLDTGDEIIIDVDGKSRQEIHDRIKYVLGKTDEMLKMEALRKQKLENPANFGWISERQCMCEVVGQQPCPEIAKIPDYLRFQWRSGYKYKPTVND